jgi:hypothetical protein
VEGRKMISRTHFNICRFLSVFVGKEHFSGHFIYSRRKGGCHDFAKTLAAEWPYRTNGYPEMNPFEDENSNLLFQLLLFKELSSNNWRKMSVPVGNLHFLPDPIIYMTIYSIA